MGDRPRMRGRPRGFDRDAALKAAMLLFWRHGYDGVSIAQLATAMGIAPPSLYAAFGPKEQLYREAVQLYLSSGRLGLKGLEEEARAKDGVHAVLRSAAKAFTQPDMPPGCMVGVGALRCAEENGIIEKATADLRRLSAQAMQHRIERARKDGELGTSVPPQALTDFYTAIVEGMSVLACDGASRERLLRLADTAMAAWPS